MSICRTTILGLTLLLALLGSQALAGPPSYLLLKRSSAPQGHRAGQPAGVGYAAPAQGYAYGWFGACPRVHPERQMGNYRANVDWRIQ